MTPRVFRDWKVDHVLRISVRPSVGKPGSSKTVMQFEIEIIDDDRFSLSVVRQEFWMSYFSPWIFDEADY